MCWVRALVCSFRCGCIEWHMKHHWFSFLANWVFLLLETVKSVPVLLSVTGFSSLERIWRTWVTDGSWNKWLEHESASQTQGKSSVFWCSLNMTWKRECYSCFSYLSLLIEWSLSGFIGFGTGKSLAAENMSPQSPGASTQGGNSPKGDTGPGSPRSAQQSLEEGKEKENSNKRGERNGMTFLTLMK